MTRLIFDGNRGLRVLGAVIAASGAAAIFAGLALDNWIWQSLGVVAAIVGALATRLHLRRRRFPEAAQASDASRNIYSELPNRPGIWAWVWAVGLTLLCFASFVAMDIAQRNGGHTVWPVYAVAVTGVGCACAWGYIAAKMGSERVNGFPTLGAGFLCNNLRKEGVDGGGYATH